MQNATAEILNELSAKGYRITKARKDIVKKLASQKQPISIQALCAMLSGTDEASVYRTVRMLLKEGFLEEILLASGAPVYAIAHGHHHHAVCTSCGVMEHIDCHTRPTDIPASFRSIASHEVTLYGLCKKCG